MPEVPEAAEPSDAESIWLRPYLFGDLDKDRRRDRTALDTSTCRMCVGEGTVRVPPSPLEKVMVPAVPDSPRRGYSQLKCPDPTFATSD